MPQRPLTIFNDSTTVASDIYGEYFKNTHSFIDSFKMYIFSGTWLNQENVKLG